MKRTVNVFKTRPVDWPEKPEAGTYKTPFGTLTITDKGTSTIAHDGEPPVHMIAKKKHRKD